ncbi:galectin-8-like isoform X4 [Pristis pectinata]|uniref:galectin-8-like isoform X4 n=1 Tax=Pristis pectinata TaxID=685728 RepID=UPI00223DB2D5|nr:galectin-8-like isoform X4 [Pristis pectinata]
MDFWTNPPPVYNPPIPYVGPIPGSLQDGNMIQIKGRVVPHSNRFHVNLQCGTEPGHCDVAFHFNPRFECPGYVVCNSFENRRWSSEERKHELPIQKGETFQLLILVQNDSYKVAVNDKHFLEFKHRLPLSRVNTICIDGQVEIVSLSFIKNQIQPAVPAGIGNNIQPAVPAGIGNNAGPMFPPPGANPFQAGPLFPPPGANPAGSMFPQPAAANPAFPFGPTNPFQAAPMFGPATPANLQVPFKAPIAGGLFPSKSIFIQGTIQPNPDNFVINLKPSNSSDIAFHISSRFRSEQAVVRNSFIQNSWNKEERNLAKNPFVPGQQFEITILCEAQSFKVSVNGCHAFDFNYRYQPIQQINELQIQGDVTLSKVLL